MPTEASDCKTYCISHSFIWSLVIHLFKNSLLLSLLLFYEGGQCDIPFHPRFCAIAMRTKRVGADFNQRGKTGQSPATFHSPKSRCNLLGQVANSWSCDNFRSKGRRKIAHFAMTKKKKLKFFASVVKNLFTMTAIINLFFSSDLRGNTSF